MLDNLQCLRIELPQLFASAIAANCHLFVGLMAEWLLAHRLDFLIICALLALSLSKSMRHFALCLFHQCSRCVLRVRCMHMILEL